MFTLKLVCLLLGLYFCRKIFLRLFGRFVGKFLHKENSFADHSEESGPKKLNNEVHLKTVAIKEAFCPYCSFKFEKFPSRKRKCPGCKKTFFLRTDYSNNQERILVKEEEIDSFDKKMEPYFVEGSILTTILRNSFISELELTEYVEARKKSSHISTEKELTAIYFEFLNKKISLILGSGSLNQDSSYQLSQIYGTMAMIMSHQENLKWKVFLAEANKMTIRGYSLSDVGIKKIEILAKDCCEACAKLDGKIMTINQGLKNCLIPGPCIADWCNCCFAPAKE